MATTNPLVLRPPTTVPASTPSGYTSPSPSFLNGKWHVTHSTLPMWKSKRNVTITYTPLPASNPSIPESETDRLDDVVSYQPVDGDKVSTVHGVDKAVGSARDAWDWRGKGWLMIASSHWEVLGWGQEGQEDNHWVVTYFAKTLFTPAGLDFYSRNGNGLSETTVGQIKEALAAIPDLKSLAGEVFEVKMDKQ